jgi:hypothetical protein
MPSLISTKSQLEVKSLVLDNLLGCPRGWSWQLIAHLLYWCSQSTCKFNNLPLGRALPNPCIPRRLQKNEEEEDVSVSRWRKENLLPPAYPLYPFHLGAPRPVLNQVTTSSLMIIVSRLCITLTGVYTKADEPFVHNSHGPRKLGEKRTWGISGFPTFKKGALGHVPLGQGKSDYVSLFGSYRLSGQLTAWHCHGYGLEFSIPNSRFGAGIEFELFGNGARCSFLNRILHSMVPLVPTPARLKRAFKRAYVSNSIPPGCSRLLPVSTVNCVRTLKGNGPTNRFTIRVQTNTKKGHCQPAF